MTSEKGTVTSTKGWLDIKAVDLHYLMYLADIFRKEALYGDFPPNEAMLSYSKDLDELLERWK